MKQSSWYAVAPLSVVMLVLVTSIHDFAAFEARKTWMVVTSTTMTSECFEAFCPI
jgi:hypothetical protein